MRVLTKSGVVLFLAVVAVAAIALITRVYSIAPHVSLVETKIKLLLADAGDPVSEIRSNARFHVFPPEFVLSRPEIITERGSTLRAAEIRIGFGLGSLLTGAFNPSSIAIIDSEIVIAATPTQIDYVTTETILAALVDWFGRQAGASEFDHVTTLHFKTSKIRIGDGIAARDFTIQSAVLNRSGNGAFSLSGDVASPLRKIALDLDIGALSQSAIQERTTRFSMTWDDLVITGSGATTFGADLQFLGSLAVDTTSLASLGSALRIRSDLTDGLTAKLKAQARLSFSTLTLSDMTLQMGDTKINGNMVVDIASAIPRVTGTFATSELDLSGVTDRLGLTRRSLNEPNARQWPDGVVPDVDLDLRLSSDRIAIHESAIDNVALSIIVRDHKAEMTIASANLFDGSVSGKFRIDAQDAGSPYRIAATLAVEAIDVEKFGIAFFDSRRVTGIAAGQIEMTSSGRSSLDALASLNGALNFTIDDTTVSGIDLLTFLQRVESRPVGAVLGFRNGTTRFEQGQIALKIENGIANLGQAKFTQFPELQVRLGGLIDLVEGRLDLKGHATASSAQSAQRSIDLPFALQGGFDDPAFIPDFINVSKQSGPIAP